jgi:hypothetical protein
MDRAEKAKAVVAALKPTPNNWQAVTSGDGVTIGQVIRIDFEHRDSVLWAVLIRDIDGNFFRVCRGQYGELQAFVPATKKKFRLHGTLMGLNVDEVRDNEDEANRRKQDLLLLGQGELEIEEIQVPE